MSKNQLKEELKITYFICFITAILFSGYEFYNENTIYSLFKGVSMGTGIGLSIAVFFYFIIPQLQKLIFENILFKYMKSISKLIPSEDNRHLLFLIIYFFSTTSIGIVLSFLFGRIQLLY
jgi:hypothetical protein